MKKLIIFPDAELVTIAAVNSVLTRAGETGIRVAVRKASPQETPPAKQITIRSDGGTVTDRFLKEEAVGLNLFVRNENRLAGYAEANRLTRLLEAILPVAGENIAGIKNIIVTGITPVETETEEQQRYIRINVLLSGSYLQL